MRVLLHPPKDRARRQAGGNRGDEASEWKEVCPGVSLACAYLAQLRVGVHVQKVERAGQKAGVRQHVPRAGPTSQRTQHAQRGVHLYGAAVAAQVAVQRAHDGLFGDRGCVSGVKC